MKALEILYSLNEAVSLSKNYPSDELLDEAISELEALSLHIAELKMMEEDAQQYALKCRKELEELQSRSCDGCKYIRGSDKTEFCILKCLPTHIYGFEFCCNRYEPKEQ